MNVPVLENSTIFKLFNTDYNDGQKVKGEDMFSLNDVNKHGI